MFVRRHATVESFLDEARDFLLRDEAENHLVLGMTSEWDDDRADGLLCTLADESGLVACAVHPPPYPLIVTRAPEEAVEALVAHLPASYEIPRFHAPDGTAEIFVRLWTRRTSTPARRTFHSRIHSLERVEPGLHKPSGDMRQAGEADLDLVAAWVDAFCAEAGMPMPPSTAEDRIAQGAVYLWDDGGAPVTMAAWAGPTPNGVRVNLVYTPPELRGRGYATACVARLSQLLLDQGRRFCFLFTDIANPTSNRIYRRIGYRPVCDVSEYHFG